MKTKRGLIITRFNPITRLADPALVNLIRNSKYNFDVYDGNSVDFAIWADHQKNYQGSGNQIIASEALTASSQQWQNNAIQYYKDHADEYDLIISWISDPESHHAALQIKADFPTVKWIAFLDGARATDFSGLDVCHNAGLREIRAIGGHFNQISKQDNPFVVSEYIKREQLGHGRTLRVALSPTRIAKKYLWDKGYEISCHQREAIDRLYQSVMTQADHTFILSGRDEDLSQLQTIYPKVEKFTLGFDQTMLPSKPAQETHRPSTPLKFVCCGFLNGQTKRMASFIGALSELRQHDQELDQKIKIDFYGFISRKDLAEITNQNVADLISIHSPQTSYKEKLTGIAEADWVVLIDENVSRKSDYNDSFPIEIIEYIGLRKPIFAISQYSSITADIITSLNCGLTVTHSSNEIALYLAKILYQDYHPVSYRSGVAKRFDAQNEAKVFDDAVADVLASSR